MWVFLPGSHLCSVGEVDTHVSSESQGFASQGPVHVKSVAEVGVHCSLTKHGLSSQGPVHICENPGSVLAVHTWLTGHGFGSHGLGAKRK